MFFILKVVFLVKFKHSPSASVHRKVVRLINLSSFLPSPYWGVVGVKIPAAWKVEESQNLDIWGNPITFPRIQNRDNP